MNPTRHGVLVRRFPTVVVSQTFSKSYGLAGLRIGYEFGSPEIVDQLRSMQLPFGSITSATAAAASSNAETQLRQRVGSTDECHILTRRLRSMGRYTTDGHANVVYLPDGAMYWPGAFRGGLPRVRCYPHGAMRIAVGRGRIHSRRAGGDRREGWQNARGLIPLRTPGPTDT